MSVDVIFVEDAQGMSELAAAGFKEESDLQGLLEQHPGLLSGAQMTPENPREFVLVSREFGVPDHEGGGGRWSLDHLFVDQDAIPTLVEVKRATDTRTRREVVGQVLDYAANGTRHWPVDDLRFSFDQTQTASGRDPSHVLDALVGRERAEGFWSEVEGNLRDGRVRLVFLADRIPPELRRIVEWLNEQTTHAEVLAVEVAQYGSSEHRVLVPRLIGSTTRAREGKRGSGPGPGFVTLLAEAPERVKQVGALLDDWAEANDIVVTRTHKGRRYLCDDGNGLCTFYPHWDGVEMRVAGHRDRHPEQADSFLRAINEFTGKSLSTQAPIVSCEEILDGWDAFEPDILTRFAHAFASDEGTGVPSSGTSAST